MQSLSPRKKNRPTCSIWLWRSSGNSPTIGLRSTAFAAFVFDVSCMVGIIDHKHIQILHQREDEFLHLRIRHTWLGAQSPMRVFKWTVYFDPHSKSSIAPVRVNFSELCHQLFEKAVLFQLANLFGTPLKIDNATATCTRPSVSYPRGSILVHPHPGPYSCQPYANRSYWQSCFFEDVPNYCSRCRHSGHHNTACKASNSGSLVLSPSPPLCSACPVSSAGSPPFSSPTQGEGSSLVVNAAAHSPLIVASSLVEVCPLSLVLDHAFLWSGPCLSLLHRGSGCSWIGCPFSRVLSQSSASSRIDGLPLPIPGLPTPLSVVPPGEISVYSLRTTPSDVPLAGLGSKVELGPMAAGGALPLLSLLPSPTALQVTVAGTLPCPLEPGLPY